MEIGPECVNTRAFAKEFWSVGRDIGGLQSKDDSQKNPIAGLIL